MALAEGRFSLQPDIIRFQPSTLEPSAVHISHSHGVVSGGYVVHQGAVFLENKGSGVKGQKVSSSGEKRNKLSQERRSVSIVAQATVEASALHLAARDWPAEVLK